MSELWAVVEDMAHLKETRNPKGEDYITLTSAEFVEYLEYLVKKTVEDIPDPVEIFDITMQRVVDNAVRAGQALFQEEIKDLPLPMSLADLHERMLSAGERAMEKALLHVKGPQLLVVKGKMNSWTKTTGAALEERNMSLSIQDCEEAFCEAFKELQTGEAELYSSKEVYFDAVEKSKMAYQYLARDNGPGAAEVYDREMKKLSVTASVRLELTKTEQKMEEEHLNEVRRWEEVNKKMEELKYAQQEEERKANLLMKQLEVEKAERERLQQEQLRKENIKRAQEAGEMARANELLELQSKERKMYEAKENTLKKQLHQEKLEAAVERARREALESLRPPQCTVS